MHAIQDKKMLLYSNLWVIDIYNKANCGKSGDDYCILCSRVGLFTYIHMMNTKK